MKVATKVALGAGLLVSLLVFALVREMALVRNLTAVQHTLSKDRFLTVSSTLEVLRTLELSEEHLQKLFVTRDTAYADHLERLSDMLLRRLGGQRVLALPEDERATALALSARAHAYRETLAARRGELQLAGEPGTEDLKARFTEHLWGIRAEALSLLSVLRAGIERDVERSQEAMRRGEREAWALVGLAVLSGVLFVALTMRSLNGPLARLIAATRSVAAGRFARLAARGGDELSELARAFNAMVERLDEVDQMKRDFLSRISHELKTPLTAMQETNQLLFEELVGPLTDKQRRLLQLNLDAGRRLSGMLSRLLDVSRLEAGAVAYDVRPVELGALLSTACQEFEARMREKGLCPALTLPERPLVVYADADWLMQVFANLIDNAIKFSPPGRRLWLALKPVDGDGQRGQMPERGQALTAQGPCAQVTVADEGPGIPNEAKERIFEQFFQVERRRRAGDGVGLGLAICRDIVAAHGGVIWGEGRPEGGTIFTVVLPLAAEPAENRAPGAAQRGAATEHEGAVLAGVRPDPDCAAERVHL